MSEDLLKQILVEMKDMKKDIRHIKEDVAVLKEDVTFLKEEQQQIKQAVLETSVTVNNLSVIQGRQQQVIELLSFRTIDHEAALKRVKLTS